MLTKILDWLKVNWWKVLIVPVVLYYLKDWILKLYLFFKSLKKKPDLTQDGTNFNTDIRNMDRSESTEIKDSQEKRDKIKQGIDRGNPKPSDVFNEELKK